MSQLMKPPWRFSSLLIKISNRVFDSRLSSVREGIRYIQIRVWDYKRAGLFVLLKCAQNSNNSSIK